MRIRLAAAGLTVAAIATAVGSSYGADSAPTNDPLVRAFDQVSRNTTWNLVSSVKLQFNAFHPEGMHIEGNRLFLTAVEVTVPTVNCSAPTPPPECVNGLIDGKTDRTAGAGISHLFVINKSTGALIKDVIIQDPSTPAIYHPAGVDTDGRGNLYLPVAEYRPNSNAQIYKVNMTTLQVTELFDYPDHIGGVIYDRATGDIIGQSWGSRRFYDWKPDGTLVRRWLNPEHFIDFQDCKYVAYEHQLCTGITGLNDAVVKGSTTGRQYELGGATLLDMSGNDHADASPSGAANQTVPPFFSAPAAIEHEVPFQIQSPNNHNIMRNPVEFSMAGTNTLQLSAVPDDGTEPNGQSILTYQASITPYNG